MKNKQGNMKSVTILKSTISQLGGLEKYTLRLADAFCKSGCDVTLLTSGDVPKDKIYPSIRVHSYSCKNKLSLLKIKEFETFCHNFMHQKPSEVIFGLDRNKIQTHIRAGNGVHAAYLERRKLSEGLLKSLSFKINPLHRSILSIEKQSFENPNLKFLFTNSHMVKNEILSHYNVDPKKICVIHNGVEWSEMQDAFQSTFDAKFNLAKELGLDPQIHQFLFIGNNYGRKGLKELLLALSLMKHQEFHLSIIGYDKNADLYKQFANQLGLRKKVTFFGQRKDMIKFYQVADTLVAPSHYDPFANVTVEALSMGLFIVTSKFNGASEVLTKESGKIIEKLTDPESFQLQLQLAMDHPKTPIGSQKIRSSVQHLDFPNQLTKMVEKTLK
ncbi:MAG: glycosyltransferase family 4 protein [Chlamydiae bacterium]|nr:glycosyltransferase family 4 protein [Chlamydiota bacterium]